MKGMLLHDWVTFRGDLLWLLPAVAVGVWLAPSFTISMLCYLLPTLPTFIVERNQRCHWYDFLRSAGIPHPLWLGERFLLAAGAQLVISLLMVAYFRFLPFNGLSAVGFCMFPSLSVFTVLALLFQPVYGRGLAALMGVAPVLPIVAILASCAPFSPSKKALLLPWVLVILLLLLALDLLCWRMAIRLYSRSDSFDCEV